MSNATDFIEFPKIARLRRSTVVTEKIDGTNAQVYLAPCDPSSRTPEQSALVLACKRAPDGTECVIYAGSRSRYVVPGKDDNFGWAAWVQSHADELAALGPGRHYGEWWGSGIQRGYGLRNGEKRFSLFNVGRWKETPPPACCSLVPTLYEGDFDMLAIEACLSLLRTEGSRAAPGFMKPEGVVVFHAASRTLFKRTIDKDDEPKGLSGGGR